MRTTLYRAFAVALPMFAALPANVMAAVGRTPGAHAVSPTGAFTYQVPLWAAPGAGGVQPNLTLSYDSQRGGGIVGPGWALTGLSAITRCNKTVAQDGASAAVTLSYSDAFCLDGKRLRLTSGGGLGTYGQAGTTYETEIADFTQVTAIGTSGNGPTSFVAKAKNGLILEFGNTADSRITSSSAVATPYMWLVSKVRDRAGNSYVVTYGTGASGTTGIGVPLSISYSPTSAGASTYINWITFEYEAKAQVAPGTIDPAVVGYVSGTQVVNTNLLRHVNVFSSSTLRRRYSLGYETAPTTTRARLMSVTECASGSDCLAPTVIAYQNGGMGVSGGAMVFPGSYHIGSPDVNGDGREDLLFGDAGGAKVALASGAGFGTPISITSSPAFPIYGDVTGSGKDELLVRSSSSWILYTWNGTGFSQVGTGISVPTNAKAALIDLDGDGRDEFVATSNTYNASPRYYTINVYTYPNVSAGGFPSFLPQVTYTKGVQCGGPIAADLPCDAAIYEGQDSRSRTRSLDFDGDGRAELALSTLIPNVLAGESVGNFRFLRWNGTTYVEGGAVNATYNIGSYTHWNDDPCTDIVLAPPSSGVLISRCGEVEASFVGLPGVPKALIDWNSDGRIDVLVQYGSNFGVAFSTGTGVTAVSDTGLPFTDAFVFDQNADGFQELGTWNASGIVLYPHAASGVDPDLVTSITDGLGVNVSPTYVSIANGNYTKGSGATYPETDFQGALHVVSSLSATSGASDGSAATYSSNFWYYSARANVTGRGFGGFERIRTTDGRNGIIRDVYSRTAFPYTGMIYQDDLLQSDGSTVISRTTVEHGITNLDTSANNQRYFPYVDASTTVAREVGGAFNGALIKTTTRDPSYDSFGNATQIVTTVTDSLQSSPQNGQQWTSTVANTITPDNGANWCLGHPTQTTITNTAPNVPTIVRTATFAVDYAYCRVDAETAEPGNSQLQVVTSYRYDGFGNVDRVIVTPAAGQGQDPRTSWIYWGASGRHPETITNALSQQTAIGWNHALGVRTSITDPNGIVTSWLPDAFGRVTRETRADGTSTVFALSACDSSNGYCGVTGARSQVEVTLHDPSDAIVRADSQLFDVFDRPQRTLQQVFGSIYSEVTRTYDVYGRLASESIPHAPGGAASNVSYAYDLLGRTTRIRRPTSASDPSNHDTLFDYQGLSVVQTDALNRNTTQRRNAIGLIAQMFDASGSDTDYEYDAFGNLLKTRDVLGNEIVLTYNVRGMKMTSSDPDMGNWSYTYYPLGELKSQTDAKSQPAMFTYDALSRPLTRTETEGITNWVWGTSAADHNIGQLESIGSSGYSESYTYDTIGRLSRRRIVSDATYDYDYTYDSTTGQLGTLTYPTSTSSYRLTLQYAYQNATLYQVSGGGTTFWQANAVNPLGQVTADTLGNGVITSRAIDAVTGLLSSIQSGTGGGASLQNESYLFDKLGNLEQRQNNNLGLTENFHYDTLNRLDYSTLGGVMNLDMTYDVLGNVTARSDIANGATWTYHMTKKHAVVQAGSNTYSYDANGNAITRNGHQITWSSYNYPTVINGPNKSMTFSYGPDRQRFRQIYNNGSATETTMYIGGALEKVTAGGVTDWRHYVSAGGKTVAIVSRKSDGTNTTRYLLQDHQGSVANILNDNGTSFVAESFAAFGGRRDASTWTGACPCPDLQKIASVSRSGYTGHEMIGGHSMGLIHMNGRVQDSVTGSFLSADPFIQAPHFSQSFNRYSYTFNNPLSYTDPSGFKTLVTGDWRVAWSSSGGEWHLQYGQQGTTIAGDSSTFSATGPQVPMWVYEPGGGLLDFGTPGVSLVDREVTRGEGEGSSGPQSRESTVGGIDLSTTGEGFVRAEAVKPVADWLVDYVGDVRAAGFHLPGNGSLEGNLAAFPMIPIFRAESAAAGSLAAIRATYLRSVDDFVGLGQSMRAAGASAEQSARLLVPLRNQLKLDLRAQGSWFAARSADLRNLVRYGNRAGPTADQLYERHGTWERVLESLGRTNSTVDEMLGVGR